MSLKKKNVYLGEKTVSSKKGKKFSKKSSRKEKVTNVPVFKTKGVNSNGSAYNFMKQNPRDRFVDTRTLDQKISDLESERDDIDNEITKLKELKKTQVISKRPENWNYKSDKVRTTYFDEQQFLNGDTPEVPRVVTVVWSHNSKNGLTRYGAVQRTKGYSSEVYDKYNKHKYTTQRYSKKSL